MKQQVEVGQVWKSKDKRETRYVLIDSVTDKDAKPAMWTNPCTVSGKILRHGRGARIKVSTLQTRFELVERKG